MGLKGFKKKIRGLLKKSHFSIHGDLDNAKVRKLLEIVPNVFGLPSKNFKNQDTLSLITFTSILS